VTSTGSSSQWTLWQKLREPLVSAFIVLNVVAIALVLSPAFPSRQILLTPFLPYLFATGLFQGSGVFVPRPHVYNIYLTAEIIYSDGSKEDWKNVRMEELNLMERFQKERFRKWSRQNMDTPKPLKWWPETAAYLARLHQRNGKTPVEIRLVRHRTDTTPPGSNEQRQTIHDVFYVHKVTPEDLR
jgi:hypothetical protein